MSRAPLGSTLFEAVRMLFIAILKLIAIAFAWVFKIAGMILTKLGESLEKIITR